MVVTDDAEVYPLMTSCLYLNGPTFLPNLHEKVIFLRKLYLETNVYVSLGELLVSQILHRVWFDESFKSRWLNLGISWNKIGSYF